MGSGGVGRGAFGDSPGSGKCRDPGFIVPRSCLSPKSERQHTRAQRGKKTRFRRGGVRQVQWDEKYGKGLRVRARGCTYRERGQLQSQISPVAAPSSRSDDLGPPSSSPIPVPRGLLCCVFARFVEEILLLGRVTTPGGSGDDEKCFPSSWSDPVQLSNSARSAFLLFGWWCGGTQGGPLTPIPSGAWTPTTRVSMRATQI